MTPQSGHLFMRMLMTLFRPKVATTKPPTSGVQSGELRGCYAEALFRKPSGTTPPTSPEQSGHLPAFLAGFSRVCRPPLSLWPSLVQCVFHSPLSQPERSITAKKPGRGMRARASSYRMLLIRVPAPVGEVAVAEVAEVADMHPLPRSPNRQDTSVSQEAAEAVAAEAAVAVAAVRHRS
jgi:hypothetical protein